MASEDFSARTTTGQIPSRLRGNDTIVEFQLAPDEKVMAQPGAFIGGRGDFQIGINWGGGVLDPIRRKWSGEKALIQEIHAKKNGNGAIVLLSGSALGQIVKFTLDGQKSLFCRKGAYLCHTGNIQITVGFVKKLRAGLFGGQHFILQRLVGYGDVFIQSLGTAIDWTLPEGMVARFGTGNLLAFEDSVGYDIDVVGGPMTIASAGEGAFTVRVQGPGRVVAQSQGEEGFQQFLRTGGKLVPPTKEEQKQAERAKQ